MFCYETPQNVSANSSDTIIVLNRVLTVAGDKSGGLVINDKDGSTIIKYIYRKKMSKNYTVETS